MQKLYYISVCIFIIISCNHKYFHAGKYHSSIDSLNLIFDQCQKDNCDSDEIYLYGQLMEVGNYQTYSRFSLEEQKMLKNEFGKDTFMVFEFGADNLKVFCHPKKSHLAAYKKDPENAFSVRSNYDIDGRFMKAFGIDYKRVFIFRNCSLRQRAVKTKADQN